MIRATKKQSDSYFEVKFTIVQFYSNSHNSQSDCWIGLNFYMESPDMLSYLSLNFQVNRSSGRHCNTGQQRLYKFCYLLPFELWTSYLIRILFLQRCDSLFWKSPSSTKILMGCNIVSKWQGFINVSESFYYKDSLFILATTRKEDFKINSTFRSDFLVYLKLLKGDKSDSSIFRIVVFRFIIIIIIIIIFFLVFGLLLLIWVNC
jgi:hypothetical protein